MTFTVFNNLAAGNQPLSLLDTAFSQIANQSITACTAAGSNTIVLTPSGNQPIISTYSNYQAFGFVAALTNTAATTINFNSVGALNAYRSDGTAIGSGDIVAGVFYIAVYNSALNSGAGGFQVLGVVGLGTNIIKTVKRQTITSTGTYTPSTGILFAVIEALGGGGGAGGANGATHLGSGGGAGAYARKLVSAATIGVSQSVTIGAAGTSGGVTGSGGTGGTTSVGALISCTGGLGGTGDVTVSTLGGAGGTASGGDDNITGQIGGSALFAGATQVCSGGGGSTIYGAGGNQKLSAGGGGTGNGYGAGGGGSWGSGFGGGAGAPGVVIITEYCSQ